MSGAEMGDWQGRSERIVAMSSFMVAMCPLQPSLEVKGSIGSTPSTSIVRRLPEPGESYDLVIASEVIEHLIMPDRTLEELTRVLKQGGHILLTVPNVAFWRFRVQALSGQVPSVTADERHLHSFSASLLEHLVRKAGLQVVQLTGLRQRFNRLSQLHFTLLCDTLLIVGRKP